MRASTFTLLTALFLAACQSAGPGPSSSAPSLAYAEARAVSDPRYAGIVMDVETGEVLYSENADSRRHPASLAKLMTLYLLFEELEAGRLSRREAIPVSRNAARQPPSKLGLKAGTTISVDDAVKAIAIRSANDVAVAVAEAIAGSEESFARRMTAKARELGLRATVFTNASGLPDPGMVTTAREIAVLARAVKARFPSEARVFASKTFSFDGKRHESTNRLLGKVAGMDGMKTGYTRASGYNLAASVNRRGRRLIIVVMGEKSGAARDGHVAALAAEYLPGGLFASR
ncbi:MAG: D-alanyl-D-alanine carboxypeptidase family protein [Propylenella sp.]